MCVMSMVVDHYREKWTPVVIPMIPFPGGAGGIGGLPVTLFTTPPQVPPITAAEIEEFRKLLERAREYDRKNNEPDCEMAEKINALKLIAEKLGVDISFIDKE